MGMNNLDQVLTNAASGLSAQTVRMNTIASNLANSGTVGPSAEETYRAKSPVFSEVTHKIMGLTDADQPVGGVRVTGIKHSDKPLERRYEPTNPAANKDGYVFATDVNPITEMTNMIAASKEYQANVEVINTTKNLIMQTMSVIGDRR